MKLVKVSVLGVTLFSLCACVNPKTIDSRQLGDKNLSCVEISAEIDELDKMQKELADKKGINGRNFATAVFFWPALIGTHSNVNDAIEAVKDRKSHLVGIYENKKCKAS